MNRSGTRSDKAAIITTRSGLNGGRTGERETVEGRSILRRSASELTEWIWTFIAAAGAATAGGLEERHFLAQPLMLRPDLPSAVFLRRALLPKFIVP